jgi:pilus assembly protein CpaD
MIFRLPVLFAGAAVALGACATAEAPKGPPLSSAADRHVIDVEQTGARLEITVHKGDASLDQKSHDDIRGFAGAYLRGGHGALIMSTPSNGGTDGDSVALMSQQTRLALVDAGVPYAAIAGSTYDAQGADSPIVLSFTAFEARAPQCAPLYTQDLAHQSDNQPWASFGCATQANLAAMVEDPHDLLTPRDQDPRDGGRRDIMLDAYRQGHVTHAQRDGDEHVAVSNVAN